MSKPKKLSEKLVELDQLVSWFDGDDVDLDEAVEKFDDVNRLADEIKADLGTLENKITVLKQKFSGE